MTGLLMLFLSAVVWMQQPAVAGTSGVEGARLMDVRALEGTLYHVQGVALDGEHV